jgi:uncharacterized membrane protein
MTLPTFLLVGLLTSIALLFAIATLVFVSVIARAVWMVVVVVGEVREARRNKPHAVARERWSNCLKERW